MPKQRPGARKDTRRRGPRAIVEAIAKRVMKGTHINHACALEKVARSAVYVWCEDDDELMAILEHARAVAGEKRRALLEQLIAKGAKTASVQLAYMERSHPREFAPEKQAVEHVEQRGPRVIDARTVVRAEMRTRARAALEAKRSDEHPEEASDDSDAHPEADHR